MGADLPVSCLWRPQDVAAVSKQAAGFTLLADGLLRLQDVRPAQ
jgi:hypothetical protein